MRFGRLVGAVYRKWRRHIDNEFRALGFSDATRSPLIGLYDHDGAMRQRDLAHHLGLEPSALVRVIGLLEARGLVTCESDESDRRSKLISLTASGRQWAEFILTKSYEIEVQILSVVAADDLAVMRRGFQAISENIPDS
jgi:MarR family transcriptional regulator for hemolysin